jgi:hypothetical protein
MKLDGFPTPLLHDLPQHHHLHNSMPLDDLGPPEKVCGGQTDNELIPNQTETYGSSWGDLNI